ncbi:MAG: acyl-CoA dehydrogenase family protein [Acidobacteria bacterium]|nr:acyl-CoA dehydrogenase family protein [Acidobacteriota bacterium]
MPELSTVRAFLEEHHHRLVERAVEFVHHDLRPLGEADSDDAARRQAREVLARLGDGGWLQPIADRDLRACGLLRETLAEVSPLADAVFALQALGSMPLLLAASDSVRETWLPRILRGEVMTAFAMTEEEAGSDVARLTSTAVRDGDGYVLSGEKSFISNAGLADLYTVFAVTDPEAGKRRLSCFLVSADTAGFEFVAPQVLSAPHPLGRIAFHGCRVGREMRLGAEGDGLKVGLGTLDRLRATVGAAACGMAQRALDEALDHALTRSVGDGTVLGDYQLIREKLARSATELAAARLLVYRALWERDLGAERTTVEAAMAKSFATEAAQRIVDDAIQVLGGRGCLAQHPVDRLYRAVRALRIYEGTTEIQHLILAGHLLAARRRRLDEEAG